MRKLIYAAAIAALLAVSMPARAGGDGFCCTNACPLAKQANTRRATGSEAVKASSTIRREAIDEVAENLKRI
jgi:hypothetical protein